MQKFTAAAVNSLSSLAHLARKNAARIAYYLAVAAALCAIAVAAEHIAGDKESVSAENALLLPAADLSTALEQLAPEPAISLPAEAQLLRSFSSQPQWNEALAQWEAHTAVDVAFPDDEVSCLLSGEVSAVGRSGVWGGFVELRCGDYLLRYASIQPDERLQIGASLAAGERIGMADGSMSGEMAMQPHAHIEAWLDHQPLDPFAIT